MLSIHHILVSHIAEKYFSASIVTKDFEIPCVFEENVYTNR